MFLSLNKMLFIFLWSFVPFLTDGFNIDVKDTVTLQGLLDPGSYFGYSVGIAVNQNTGNKWILVGAPRGNDPALPDVPRPGAVFACTFPSQGSSTCTKLDIDETQGLDSVSFGGSLVSFQHGRNDSWLGGSIEVLTSGSSDVFATCAHKWYNTYFYELRDFIYMQGLCYEVPLDLNMANVKKLPAMTSDGLRTIYVPGADRTVWNYGFAGLGISVHYTKNADHLLLGATGLLDWIGGFVDLEGEQVKVMQNSINTTDIIKPYIGFSSTSGMYFADDQTYFVVGAPREEMRGVVLFFRAGEAQHSLQNIAKVLEGSENGKSLPANAYYGATLCTMDVNNDQKDDLLVAAPMYSPLINDVFTDEMLELGIVFVYLGSNALMEFQAPPQILMGAHSYGRFGSAIANLGDINSDSYADVAIGAPYENNLQGALYIYNGYTGGVWPQYSQRILASEIDSGLRGFGISISSGKDVNLDNINDMVVGSYLSDQAVVMFGQPVISVYAQMDVLDSKGSITNYIEIGDDKQESVIVCFRYVDRRCSYVNLNVTISLDVGRDEQTRIIYAANNEASISRLLKMFSGDLVCSIPAEILTKSTNDLVSEIEIQADYVVEEITCPGLTVSATISRFNGASPGDPILQLRNKLQFKNDCPNNLCKTDLTLMAEAKYTNVDGYFVIGNQDLVVDVKVAKTGDSSYGSVFYMVYPHYLGYKNTEKFLGENDVTCSLIDRNSNETDVTLKEEESAISCLFGNPMSNDTGVGFRLFMKVPISVVNDDSTMTLRMRVATLSEELESKDNNQTITINLRHNLEATFTAISTQEQIYLEETKASYNMLNIYELYNKGPSTLQSAMVDIAFPQIQSSNKALLFLNKTEIQCEHNCGAKCSFVEDYTTPSIYSYLKGRLVSQTDKPETALSDIQNKNCRQQKCSRFRCMISNIQPNTGAVIYMHHVIDKDIEGGIEEGKSMTLMSTAVVEINKTNLISNRTEFLQQLSTSVRKRAPVKEEIPWWIILVSVLGGILLIALIVLILWKVGFFKRKKRDELEKRKSRLPDSENKVYTTYEKKRDSYTDSEGGIIDHEIPPADDDKQKY